MKNKFNKAIYYVAILGLVSLFAIYTGCKKDSTNNTTQTTGTCSDGIQNQGETGIDCGGPCTACNELCNGISSNLWWPLDSGKYWSYSSYQGMAPEEWRVCVGKVIIDSFIYYHVIRTDSVTLPAVDYYYRYKSNGDLMCTFSSASGSSASEFLVVPANPTLNQTWANGTMKVSSLTATFNTGFCSYTNLVKVDRLDQNNVVVESNYFKKGLGLVDWFYYADMMLVGARLH